MEEHNLFLKFWDKEEPTTGKVLSRIPEGDYKPDPKSRTAREIAWLLVTEQRVLVEGLERSRMEWIEVPAPATMKEVLEQYQRTHADLTHRLHGLPKAKWEASVPFIWKGQEVMRETGVNHAWGFFFDFIHHRGQVTTYLRAMGSTVPQIYGSSADEPM